MSNKHNGNIPLNRPGKNYVSKDDLKTFSRPLFNFSFISKSNHFNLRFAKSHKNFGKFLMQKLCYLSQFNDLSSCIALRKSEGIEPLSNNAVHIRVNHDFKFSKRWLVCDQQYYSFRVKAHSPYRVIGRIWPRKNIFYVLAFDPTHRSYRG